MAGVLLFIAGVFEAADTGKLAYGLIYT